MKILGRIVIVAIALALLYIAGILSCSFYREWEKENFVNEKVLSHGFVYLQREGMKGKVQNRNTGQVALRGVEWIVQNGKDSLVVFCKKGKRGYFNCCSGKVIVPVQYDRAWIFSEGVAAVVKNGKIGFIDQTGTQILPFNWKDVFCQDRAYLFKDGQCVVFDDQEKCGIIDHKGKWIVKPEYSNIGNMENGYRIVEKENKMGVIDSSFNLILPLNYDHIRFTKTGILVQQEGLKQVLSWNDMTVKVPFVFNDWDYLYYTIGEYTAHGDEQMKIAKYVRYEVWNFSKGCCYYGLMDKDGNKVTEAVYYRIRAVAENTFVCGVKNGGYSITLKIP